MLISNNLECASWWDERRQLDDLRLLGLPAGVQLVTEGESRHQLSVELVACVVMRTNAFKCVTKSYSVKSLRLSDKDRGGRSFYYF
jgi:hypothetical protein